MGNGGTREESFQARLRFNAQLYSVDDFETKLRLELPFEVLAKAKNTLGNSGHRLPLDRQGGYRVISTLNLNRVQESTDQGKRILFVTELR